eukprot:SM000097S24819  [mRNA]  locus=s97:544160:552835:+ [translate_table: standard]
MRSAIAPCAPMRSRAPYSPGQPSPFTRYARVNLRFKLPYYTKWGQNLMISGSDPLFGAYTLKRSVWMTPQHDGDDLVWQALVSVPATLHLEYRYCLVSEGPAVIKWEAGSPRRLALPAGLPDGSTVDILDTWQASQPGSRYPLKQGTAAANAAVCLMSGVKVKSTVSTAEGLGIESELNLELVAECLAEGIKICQTFINLMDIVQDGSSPEALLACVAFRKVIFGSSVSQEEEEHNVLDDDGWEDDETAGLPEDAFASRDTAVVRFRIVCSRFEKDQKVCILGDAPELGKWDTEVALPLLRVDKSTWERDVPITRSDFPIHYKYIVKGTSSSTVLPEHGPDRILKLDTAARKPSDMIITSDGSFKTLPWRGAGVAVPVFSMRSEDDVGAGEFLDLKLLVDLAVKSGLRLVQLLPVNDTSVNGMWWDSYPYSSLSVFALHPLYLRIQALSTEIPSDIMDEINRGRRALDLAAVDYEATLALKLSIARKMFSLEREKHWLKPYAAFCFLKDLFGTADHQQWGHHALFVPAKLKEASEYAKANRVILKGDLPIGVDRCSVDTWQYPTLFRMNSSTGAPPDMFDPNGQNWGFPTYNWEEMAKDNYSWWRARLTQMSKYFTAYRIDHILGFFRIWELPNHCITGLLGRFRPSIPIAAEEMEKEGIWDFNRLSEPYIRCHILQDTFGTKWTELASKYFEETMHLCYKFKPAYDTERKIDWALKPREGSPEWLVQDNEHVKKALFGLLKDIVLIRDLDDPLKFYPRFNLDQTVNFRELDDHSKVVLQRLYHDYYFVRQEDLWRENALKTLPVLMNASDMLTCGEDLGLVPACVPPVLNELGLLGLRIQRMPSEENQEFGNPATYDYMTICAPSCHDTSTMRAWWEEDADRRLRFFQSALGFSQTPPDTCTPDVARAILQQHCDSPSVFAIFPIQDLMALKDKYSERPAAEETINDPTNPRHYWRFRLHVTLEEFLRDEDWLATIQDLLLTSGRTTVAELPDDAMPSANGPTVTGPVTDNFKPVSRVGRENGELGQVYGRAVGHCWALAPVNAIFASYMVQHSSA